MIRELEIGNVHKVKGRVKMCRLLFAKSLNRENMNALELKGGMIELIGQTKNKEY